MYQHWLIHCDKRTTPALEVNGGRNGGGVHGNSQYDLDNFFCQLKPSKIKQQQQKNIYIPPPPSLGAEWIKVAFECLASGDMQVKNGPIRFQHLIREAGCRKRGQRGQILHLLTTGPGHKETLSLTGAARGGSRGPPKTLWALTAWGPPSVSIFKAMKPLHWCDSTQVYGISCGKGPSQHPRSSHHADSALISCVSSGKWVNVSVPLFPYLEMGMLMEPARKRLPWGSKRWRAGATLGKSWPIFIAERDL